MNEPKYGIIAQKPIDKATLSTSTKLPRAEAEQFAQKAALVANDFAAMWAKMPDDKRREIVRDRKLKAVNYIADVVRVAIDKYPGLVEILNGI